jgi:hypothetical protein
MLLTIISFYVIDTGRQHCELNKQLQDLLVDMVVLSETCHKTSVKISYFARSNRAAQVTALAVSQVIGF